jgi:flagellar hook-associated protein 2
MSTTTSSPLSSPGIGSGLDVNSLVSQLMAVESQPLTLLQSKATKLQTSLSAFGQLSSALSTFQSAASALSTPAKWQVFAATSSNDAGVSAATTSAAHPGNYAVRVDKLAQTETLASNVIPSNAVSVGTGSLTISLGTLSNGTFTANSANTPTTITIPAGSDSLTAIRDAINAAGAGVTASIVNVGNGSRLMLSANASGAANAIKVSVADNDGNNTDGSGLSQLAYDPAAPAGAGKNMTETVAAQDAAFNVNGIDITASSNLVTSAVEGLTLSLKQVSATPVNIAVNNDTTTLLASVNSFVKSYNDLNTTITNLTKYDAATSTGGPLQGDFTALNVLNQLRSTIQSTFSGQTGDFVHLSDVGIAFQKDGSLTLDSTKWSSATNDLGKVARLFSAIGTTGSPTSQGFAKRLSDIAANLVGPDGSITSRTAGIQSSIKDNGRQQTDMSDRLSQVEARLKKQYSALDTTLSSMQTTSTYLTQQLAALSANSKSN